MTPHVSITLLRTQTDERLIELIAAGHDRAFDAIVDRYRRPLLRYARRFLPEEARAEDVVQAAFVSAWSALRDGATVRDLRPWLYRIVHNGALNVMKKPGGDDAPLIEASDLRPGPATEVEQREDVRQALDTIAALPERQRAALLAVALEGRSHADVGEELGLNDTAVRQLVRRARTTLRVAATAVTPWPAAVWLAGLGGAQAADTATRVGELVGGVGAGTLFGGGALKAGALVAAAGAVAVGVPQAEHAVRHHHRPATAQAAERPAPSGPTPGGSGAATIRVSAPASAPAVGGATTPTSGARGDAGAPGSRRHSSPGGTGGDDRGPSSRGVPGGRDDEPQDAEHHGTTPAPQAEGDDAPDAEARPQRSDRRGSTVQRRHEDDGGEPEHVEAPEAPEQPEAQKAPEPVETHDSHETSGSREVQRPEQEDGHEAEHAVAPSS